MNSVLILPRKFTLWIPYLSTLHAAKGKQMLLLSIKSSLALPVAGGSALSMGLMLDPKVWWIWDLLQAYPQLANQPVSPLGWQTPVSCWLCPFKGTDTTNLPPAPLWAFYIPHCSSTHWALLLAVLLLSCPRCFLANTAQENRDIWDCSRAGPAPAWTSGRPGVCDPLSSLSY